MAEVTEVLDTTGVADLLGISRIHVFRLRRDQELPAFRFGRCIRFRRTEILDWLDTHREISPPAPKRATVKAS